MFFFFSLIFIAVSLITCVLAAALLFGLIKTGGVPFISTPKRDFNEILKAAELKPGEKFYDLGCGKAHLLIRAAKKYGASGVGYELSLTPYLWAKWKIWFSRVKVKVYLKDFFKADLSEADVVFCYLFPEIMAKLEPKFQKEMKPGSRVVSYGFHLPNLKPVKTIITNDDNVELGRIFVYRF